MMAATPTEPAASSSAGQTLSPRALLDFYAAKFRTEIGVQFAYRGAIAIWLLGLVMAPLISLVVWSTLARENGGTAGGFTAGEYAAYFLTVMVVNQMTFAWIMWEMEWRVKNGFFSPVLLRPLHPIHNDAIENLTFKVLTLAVLLPVTVVFAVVFDARFETGFGDILAFVPVIVGAMGLRFLAEWTISLAAFWITRTSTLNTLYATAVGFLSGLIAPLGLFPEPVRIVAAILPFRWMVAFPADVLLGRTSGLDLLIGLGMQVLWLAIAFFAMRWTWSRGARRYSAVGA